MKKYKDRKGGKIEGVKTNKREICDKIGDVCFIEETDEDLERHTYLLIGTENGKIIKL